jgi:hypothetical protein
MTHRRLRRRPCCSSTTLHSEPNTQTKSAKSRQRKSKRSVRVFTSRRSSARHGRRRNRRIACAKHKHKFKNEQTNKQTNTKQNSVDATNAVQPHQRSATWMSASRCPTPTTSCRAAVSSTHRTSFTAQRRCKPQLMQQASCIAHQSVPYRASRQTFVHITQTSVNIRFRS